MGSGYYHYTRRPIVLKQLLQNIGIQQDELKRLIPYSRQWIGHILNRAGYFPGTQEEIWKYRKAVEEFVQGNELAMKWLEFAGLKIESIWCPQESQNIPGEKQEKQENGKNLTIDWEVEMLSPEAKKIFRFSKDPFIDDIQQESDIYMGDEHRYIEAAMLDAARHSGFLAVTGEVGSGKSVIRKKVFVQLRRDNNVLIISPQNRDKKLLTASSICDAIIMDVSTEKPENRLEQKTRQVIRLLTERANSSQRHCLLIEEAHDLSRETLKYLKRFYELEELEDGFRRLLGIILVGQLEMKRQLDEHSNFDAREVIRRCQIVELGPLATAGDLEKYVALKFRRCGVEIGSIFQEDTCQAIRERLSIGKSKISQLYPLLINNYTAKALNLAARCGARKVTPEVVHEI